MRVAVLKGGSSLEREVSLRSAARVEDAAHVAALHLGQRDQLGGIVAAELKPRALVLADLGGQIVDRDLVEQRGVLQRTVHDLG